MLSKYFVTAAMAAGAVALPAIQVIDIVKAVTVTVTEGHIPPQATAAPSTGGGFLEGPAAAPAPQPTTQAVVVPITPPAPTTEAVVVPAPSPAPAPAPSTSSSSSNSVSEDSSNMLSVVNYWRQAYGLNDLAWDDSLASQAMTVGVDGDGVNEVHQLIPGINMGQVITPGQATPVPADQSGLSPFGVAYVAWLCEVSSDPELQPSANGGVSVCGVVQDVLNMIYTDTGHHDIIVSPDWTTVGCAFAPNPAASSSSTYQGLYVCNYSN